MNAFGHSRRRTARLASVLLCVAGSLALPAAVAAQPPPKDVSAIAVYVEVIPTSTGGVIAGRTESGGAAAEPAPLAPAAEAAVEQSGGADAEVLKRVATAPELGAPRTIVPAPAEEVEPESERVAVPNVAVSVTDGSSRIPWLLGALALLSGLALGAAFARRRSGDGNVSPPR